jgi:rod shape-determining protein MreB
MISVPTGASSVEAGGPRRCLKAGAREAYLIEEPLAAAIGANVDQRPVREHGHRHRRRRARSP